MDCGCGRPDLPGIHSPKGCQVPIHPAALTLYQSNPYELTDVTTPVAPASDPVAQVDKFIADEQAVTLEVTGYWTTRPSVGEQGARMFPVEREWQPDGQVLPEHQGPRSVTPPTDNPPHGDRELPFNDPSVREALKDVHPTEVTLDAKGSILLPHVQPGTLVSIVHAGKATTHVVKDVDHQTGTITCELHPTRIGWAPGWDVIAFSVDSIHDHVHDED